MPPNLMYVGTYTDTIHTLRLDPETGQLFEVATTLGVSNPSYLLLHPTGDWLYSVNELLEYEGRISAAPSAPIEWAQREV